MRASLIVPLHCAMETGDPVHVTEARRAWPRLLGRSM